jgi:hypothetical protein
MIDLKYIAALKSPEAPYNDIDFNADGDIVMIEGVDRVKQDIVKMLQTEMGLMPYPNYGTNLMAVPGNTPYDSTLLNAIAGEIISAIHYQILNETSTLPNEQVAEIRKLSVDYSGSAITIDLSIWTRDQQEIVLGVTV